MSSSCFAKILLLFFLLAGPLGLVAGPFAVGESAAQLRVQATADPGLCQVGPPARPDNFDPRMTPVVRAVKRASPWVVNITTLTTINRAPGPFGFWGPEDDMWPPGLGRLFDRPEFQQRQVRESLGSGVIIDGASGLVLSNEHVIAGASSIKVRLADGREFEAELIGSNADFDLAVLRLTEAGGLPGANLADSDEIMIGEPVIAIGNPYGLSHTVTTGVVSALGRSVETRKHGLYTDFIQTDAAINPGNSGGPLLNINGEVIGINTAIYAQGSGIGFAIPINKAKRVIAELLSRGEIRPVWLGLSGQNVDERTAAYLGLPDGYGLLVTEIFPASPAERAGIRPGDLIRSVNGIKIEDREHYLQIMRNHIRDEELSLVLVRDGEELPLAIQAVDFSPAMAQRLALDRWGLTFSGKANKRGLTVAQVRPNSPAARLGLKAGDVVLQIGNQAIDQERDFVQAVLRGYMQQNLMVAVARNNRIYYARMVI